MEKIKELITVNDDGLDSRCKVRIKQLRGVIFHNDKN